LINLVKKISKKYLDAIKSRGIVGRAMKDTESKMYAEVLESGNIEIGFRSYKSDDLDRVSQFDRIIKSQYILCQLSREQAANLFT